MTNRLALIAAMPCIICETFNMPQNSPTTVHHCFHGRFSTRRAGHDKTIPLCDGHHQGDFDTSKIAIHREKKRWARLYGEDHTYLKVIDSRLPAGTKVPPKTKNSRKISSRGFCTNRDAKLKRKLDGIVERR